MTAKCIRLVKTTCFSVVVTGTTLADLGGIAYIFTASLTRLDMEQKQYSANYAGGEKAGQSWTEKVMGVKQTQEPPKTLPQDLQEGVEEDEWVSCIIPTSPCLGG